MYVSEKAKIVGNSGGRIDGWMDDGWFSTVDKLWI